MKQQFIPIILGSDENAYGNARLYIEAFGIKPLLLCTRRLTPTVNSCLFNVKLIPNFDKDEVFPVKLKEVLKEYKELYEKILVISCSDYYTSLLSKHYDEFDGMIDNKFISKELLDTLDTKDKFYALCEKYGMDYPKTYVAAPDDRIDAVDKLTFDFPIVVKPENSNAYEYLHTSFEGKKKVFFFDNREQYLTVIDSMNKSDYKGKLIIQEYIHGDDCDMRVMNSYSDSDGKVRAMCLGQPVLEEYHPKTLGNYAAIISRSNKELYEKIKAFLENIGYVGFSNIDMKYDKTRDKYYMMEINPRLGRSSFFVRGTGINMMEILTNDIVFGNKNECIYGNTASLWSNVPKCVIFKYVGNNELKKEARQLIKQKKYSRTLVSSDDMNLSRFLRIEKYYFGQYRNFKRYYFKKEKNK